jgi:hypothetical protein
MDYGTKKSNPLILDDRQRFGKRLIGRRLAKGVKT